MSSTDADLRDAVYPESSGVSQHSPQVMDSNSVAAIQTIRNWIKEKHKFLYRQDDAFILRFLRTCQFNIDVTKSRIDRFVDIRRANPQWFEFSQKSVQLVEKLYEQGVGYPVIPKNEDGQIVCVAKPGAFDPKKYSMDDYVTFMTLASEALLDDARFQIHGCHVIVDYKDIGLAYMSLLTPSLLWRTSKWQTIVPIKFIKFHVLNASTFLNALLLLVKFFASREVNSQIVVHNSDYKSIHEFIDPDQLPLEYGGTAGPERHLIDTSIKQFKKSLLVQEIFK